ncbi:helix-turn-helix domain-containing protein [Candidatus Woesearchaeota archaeon]|jgi:peptide subunit release factor 1 (eRF1)/intein/homing endonuclease|nr:helix-turn-helix domain-containing protein [Candidatus Woesearchaeota archaeon]
MALTASEKLHLKRFIKELKSHRAPHTEFVTVYIPTGYDIIKIIQHLAEEQGTASNIKSAVTKKNVQGALEKMIQHLRGFSKTPAHGLAVFSGNVAAAEGKQDMRVWSMEPPVPLKTRIYRCDKLFATDLLEELITEHQVYGLVVLDRRDAMFALLKGKTIIPLKKTHSEVPGKTRAGGQCLVKDSFIQSCDGEIIQIKNSHNPMVVKSMVMDDFSLKNSPVTDKWEVKKSKVYKITTKFPRLQVESSKDHIFFTRTNEGIKEKAAEELKEGDFLIMPEKINVNGKFKTINAIQYYNSFNISKKGQNFLRTKRENKNLLQKDLAKQVELTQTAISSYEIGKRNAKRIPLQTVCVALDINFYDFLNQHCSQELYKNIKLPVIIDEKFAQFLGYLVGDGCIEKDRITFFEQSKDVTLFYKEQFENYLEMSCSYRFRESKNYHQLRFTSRPLVRLILSEFPEIKLARNTLIPQKILQSPNKVVARFLRGFFDAEGYSLVGRGIGLGINNKALAQQIQMALLRFGIISSLHEYDNRRNPYSNNPRFTNDITEKTSLKLFQQKIGFSCKKKQTKLEKTISKKTNKSYTRQLLVPGSEIRKIIERNGLNTNNFPKVTNFFRDERMMSKEVFRNSVMNEVKDQKLFSELEKIYNYPFLPVKINKIEVRKEEVDMVDISVGNQNFIANGFLVHNSAQRFARLREGAAKEHFKKIAEYMKEQFLHLGNNLKGIIIGGPGTTVNDFLNKDYITGDVKKKIIGTKDLSYTDEPGLQELLDKSQDLLANEEISREKATMYQFFMTFREHPKKVTYGKEHTLKALEMNAVSVLLLSEVLEEDEILDFEEKAKLGGAEAKIISTETREGVQLRDLGGVAAILRFEVE